MNVKLFLLITSMVSAILPAFANEVDNTPVAKNIEVITVNGDFLSQNLQKSPVSVAVIPESLMQQRNALHLEDVLNTSANINFSSGASRARFFQIRGIGDRSEFVDSVNPSVGVSIDGIDYSGIGTIATLFDIDQVEIFRGPQGTRFGANAMAGMINMYGGEADGQDIGKVQLSYGNYNSHQIAAAYGDEISDGLYYRAAIQKLTSDGFINNTFLNRDDTNNTNELSGRLKFRWLASENLQLDLTTHYFDLDNGYDAFSLESTRETFSDQPGFDKQRTRAFAVTASYTGFVTTDIKLNISNNNSDLAYGFDEDWAYVGFHPWEYSSFDHYFRGHDNTTIDLRFSGKAGSPSHWIFGIYHQKKDVDLQRQAVYGFTPIFASSFKPQNNAIYGQRDWQIDNKITITTGLRIEKHTADYADSLGIVVDVDDIMWGGKFNVSYQMTEDTLIYASLSRGYKAGGVNGEAIAKALIDGEDTTTNFLQKRTTFDPETLQTIELGIKGYFYDDKLQLRFSTFYSNRKDMQLKGSVQEAGTAGGAPIFVGYIENAASGNNYGLEMELNYQLSSSLQLFSSVGWLKTKVNNFTAQNGTNMNGREQAHAPTYQYNVGLQYDIDQNWFIYINAEGKDDYYFSMSHNAESDSVNLFNMSVNYQKDEWDLTIWGRNILDNDYAVRGFRFGNDPRDGYDTHTYTQLGEPARFGVTLRYHF